MGQYAKFQHCLAGAERDPSLQIPFGYSIKSRFSVSWIFMALLELPRPGKTAIRRTALLPAVGVIQLPIQQTEIIGYTNRPRVPKVPLLQLAHLYGPAARCKPKMMILRSWSCASVSGLT